VTHHTSTTSTEAEVVAPGLAQATNLGSSQEMYHDLTWPEWQAQVKTVNDAPIRERRRTGIFLQDACFLHRFIRSRINTNIVERPERLRAVMVGLSAAVARLEEALLGSNLNLAVTGASRGTAPPEADVAKAGSDAGTDALEAALDRMTITQPPTIIQPTTLISPTVPVTIIHSQASLDLLKNSAVKYVHGDIGKDVYLENLVRWTQESYDKISKGESEIPKELSQGDLYRQFSLQSLSRMTT
jgi:histone deacetylase HOS3